MEILIIGTGYVGLVTGASFAEMGYKVTCLDTNEEKIAKLKNCEIPIFEPGLEELVRRNSQAKRLSFTSDYKTSVERADICFLAVDTPVGENGSADTRSITKACLSLAESMNGYKVIVNKSTAPVGTCEYIRKVIKEALEKRGVDPYFDVVSNPEFLKEGSAVNDFMRPDRVIVGCDNDRAYNTMRTLYKPFMLSQERLYFMDIASAELTKYAANAMLATRISFMNWLSQLAEKTGADILQVRKGIGSDSRIGFAFLWAGIGFGGSCFPKDLKALQSISQANQVPSEILDAVMAINERQKESLFKKVEHYFQDRGGLQDKTIGILGLSFKPDTDDVREAPALVLIEKLLKKGVQLRLYDPVAINNAKIALAEKNIPTELLTWCDDALSVSAHADAIILVTEWKEFRLLDFATIIEKMKGTAFFDGRNQYNPEEMAKKGFDYFSIGRKPSYNALENEFSWVTKEVIYDDQ
jgi:UDPglucose 6-dehydrogenase